MARPPASSNSVQASSNLPAVIRSHGNIYLCGGTLQVNSDTALGNAANQVSFGGATAGAIEFTANTTSARTFVCAGLDTWNDVQVDTGVTATLTNGISQGGINKVGNGTLILGNCDPSGAGNIDINAGVLQIGNGGTTGAWVGAYTNNANLSFNRSDAFTVSNTINGNGQLHFLGSGTMTLNSSLGGSASLYMDGPGTLVATATSSANNYGGDIYLNNGTVQFTKVANLGENAAAQYVHFQGGTLEYLGTDVESPAQTFNPVTTGTLDISVSAPSTSYLRFNNANQITGAGALNVTGNGMLVCYNGGNYSSFTGTLNVAGTDPSGSVQLLSTSMSAAKVNVSTGSTLAATGTISLGELTGPGTVGTISGQAAASLIVGDIGNFTFSGTFQNSTVAGILTPVSSLTKQGSGTMNITSANGSASGINLTVTVNAGKLVLGATDYFAAFNIISGTTATVTGAGNGARSMLYTPSLSDNGTLDLMGNDLDFQAPGSAGLTILTSLIKSGYAAGSWTGLGIISSTASSDVKHLTTLGVLQNNDGFGMAIYTALDGHLIALNDVVVKYTYYGDANLDGKVDGSDYSRIDSVYVNNQTNAGPLLTGWQNGDFNYDGVINGSDYTLIDNGFNTQGAVLSDQLAYPTAEVSGISNISVVPEPVSNGAMLLLAMTLVPRRVRKTAERVLCNG